MQELTTSNFDSAIAKGNVVVDFWAPWCGPCRMLGPVLEEASKSQTDTTFVKVNVDEQPEIAQRFGVRGIPTLVYFKDGKQVSESVGAMSKPQLEAKVKQAFGK
jgi:thioredoxin 1